MSLVETVAPPTPRAPHSRSDYERNTCVVIHNHWIHYKDLLFRAMEDVFPSFTVLFTAESSRVRLPARALEEAPYAYEVSFPGDYERICQPLAALRTWCALARLRPKVLIISGWYDAAGWAAWVWGVLHGTPMLLWAESNLFDHPRHAALEAVKRFYVRRFRRVHVYGQSNREYMLQLGMEDHQILTKRAVLDVRLFARDPGVRKDPDCLTLLYVGRLSPEKNLERLITAIHRLRCERLPIPVKLVLAGYGPLETKLRQTTEALGLGDAVVFMGAVTQDRLPAVYSAADIFVLPSTREPWGLVVNEAMCCELPVVVSNRCGCAKDLVTAETGWMLDPYDIAGITETLRRVSGIPPERLAAMGKKARDIAARYTPENCADRVCDSIRRAIRYDS